MAAQPGVRYSLENPSQYLGSNIIGSFNILELVKDMNVEHLLMASTSQFMVQQLLLLSEASNSDAPSIYAALRNQWKPWHIPIFHIHKILYHNFSFFTVYGSWGRPDMACIKSGKQ